MRARRRKTEPGRCAVCRKAVTVIVLSETARVAEQHPKATTENQLGCRGSGAAALDRFAPEVPQ